MNQTANNLNVVTEAPEKGLTLPCPKCGEAEASIALNLDDLDTCHCLACDEEFTLGEIRDLIAKWQRVLRWVELFPAE